MKLVIFDIDGTLSCTNIIDQSCFLSTAQDLIHSSIQHFDPERFTHFTDQNIVIELFEWYKGSPPEPQAYEGFRQLYLERLRAAQAKSPEAFQAVPGAQRILQALSSGWQIALATGCWQEAAQLKLEYAGIEAQHYPIATSDNSRSRQGILQHAIAQVAAKQPSTHFDKIVYVGDGIWDMRTCAALGIPFVGIEAEQQQQKRELLGAHFLLENYLDLNQVLKCLHNAVVPS